MHVAKQWDPRLGNDEVVANTLTEAMIEGGKRLLMELDAENVHADGAFWYYFDDQKFWKLMLALPGLEKHGPKAAYKKVQSAIERMPGEHALSLEDVAILKPTSPLYGLLRVAIRTGPGISGVRFSENVVNGHLITDAFIYRLQ
jgi:hypothetical protein